MATLDPLRAEVRRRAEDAVQYAAGQMQARLKTTSPHDSYRMRDSTTVVARGLTAHARANVPYASFVAEGTRGEYKIPKVARKRRKKGERGLPMLSFIWPGPNGPGGRVWFAQVTHPGIKANPWWDEGLGKWNEYLSRAFR